MPNMDKTWTVVGTSVQRGEKSLRLANGSAADRQRVLEKAGCTEIRLFDLPHPMRQEEAVAWLAAQGDAVPVPQPKEAKPPKPPKAAKPPTARRRTITRLATELMSQPDVVHIAFGELGQKLYEAPRTLRVLPWDQCSVVVRQEFARNAARAAGHATPRGMFPELEAWLAQDGVLVQEDGTLVEQPIQRRG